ncbi:glycosyltransferase family 4 protein [Glycocaulis sp.]|uniref:glycosyltransferase family 4 protein n=1 Tax=Glycocaulis sp. TaxID=1969725 RepID=UPI003D1934BC
MNLSIRLSEGRTTNTKHRLIFNASTNTIGGGVQNAANFINECCEADPAAISWTFLVSSAVARNCEALGLDVHNDSRFHVIDPSPARHKASRQRIRAIVETVQPGLVYTMAGPAYVRFPAMHVLGCSEPFVSHGRLENYFAPGLAWGLRTIALSLYKLAHFHRAEHLIFQTEAARSGFLKRGIISARRTSVVPNAIGRSFVEQVPGRRSPDDVFKAKSEQRSTTSILVPSAYYRHKNLDIIVPTAAALKEITSDPFCFTLTLPPGPAWGKIEAAARAANVSHCIRNAGPFSVSEAPGLYLQSDIMFLPTRLETFSASYLEAMWCGVPIVTSALDFAMDICRDAALYTDTLSPTSAAATLAELISSIKTEEKKLYMEMVRAGNDRVLNYPTSPQRSRIINEIINGFI